MLENNDIDIKNLILMLESENSEDINLGIDIANKIKNNRELIGYLLTSKNNKWRRSSIPSDYKNYFRKDGKENKSLRLNYK